MGLKFKGIDLNKLVGAFDELLALVMAVKVAVDKAGDAGKAVTEAERDGIIDAASALAKAID